MENKRLLICTLGGIVAGIIYGTLIELFATRVLKEKML